MKRLQLIVLCASLTLSGCAYLSAKLPRNPDGSFDSKTFVKDIEFGIVADCEIHGAEADVCALGLPAIKALEDGTPESILAGLKAVAMRYPHTMGWINYAIKALGGNV